MGVLLKNFITHYFQMHIFRKYYTKPISWIILFELPKYYRSKNIDEKCTNSKPKDMEISKKSCTELKLSLKYDKNHAKQILHAGLCLIGVHGLVLPDVYLYPFGHSNFGKMLHKVIRIILFYFKRYLWVS